MKLSLDTLLDKLDAIDSTWAFSDEAARVVFREQWDRICRENGWEPEEVDIALEERLSASAPHCGNGGKHYHVTGAPICDCGLETL